MTSRCTIQHQVTAHCQISFPALRGVVKDQYILGLAQWKSWDFSRVLIALSFLGCLMKVHLLFLLTWELILYSYIHTLTFPKTEWLSCTRFSIFTGNQNLLLMRCLIYEYKVSFTSNVTLVDELFTEVPPKNGFEKRRQSIFNKYNPYCLGPFQSLNKGNSWQGAAGWITAVLITFWLPLWSIIEQAHSNMETIYFMY